MILYIGKTAIYGGHREKIFRPLKNDSRNAKMKVKIVFIVIFKLFIVLLKLTEWK